MRPVDEERQWLEAQLSSGVVRAVITKRFALTDLRAAHELSETGRVVGKILITTSKNETHAQDGSSP